MIAAATLSNEHVIVSIFAFLSLMILSTLTMGQEMFASGSSEEDNDDDDEQEVSDNENFDASDDISSTFLTFEDPKYFYSITYPSTWKVLPDEFGFDEGFNFNSPDGKTIVSVDTEEAFRNRAYKT